MTGFSWCVISIYGTLWSLRNSQQTISSAIFTWTPTTCYQMMSGVTLTHWDSMQRWYVSTLYFAILFFFLIVLRQFTMINWPVYSWETIRCHVLSNWVNPEEPFTNAAFYCIFGCSCYRLQHVVWLVTWFLFADSWRCIETFQDYLPYTTTVSRTAALEVNMSYRLTT